MGSKERRGHISKIEKWLSQGQLAQGQAAKVESRLSRHSWQPCGGDRSRAGAGQRQLRDEDFKTFMARRGDWAKPLRLWALRRYSGMTLSEDGGAAGGVDYTADAMAVKRFEER